MGGVEWVVFFVCLLLPLLSSGQKCVEVWEPPDEEPPCDVDGEESLAQPPQTQGIPQGDKGTPHGRGRGAPPPPAPPVQRKPSKKPVVGWDLPKPPPNPIYPGPVIGGDDRPETAAGLKLKRDDWNPDDDQGPGARPGPAPPPLGGGSCIDACRETVRNLFPTILGNKSFDLGVERLQYEIQRRCKFASHVPLCIMIAQDSDWYSSVAGGLEMLAWDVCNKTLWERQWYCGCHDPWDWRIDPSADKMGGNRGLGKGQKAAECLADWVELDCLRYPDQKRCHVYQSCALALDMMKELWRELEWDGMKGIYWCKYFEHMPSLQRCCWDLMELSTPSPFWKYLNMYGLRAEIICPALYRLEDWVHEAKKCGVEIPPPDPISYNPPSPFPSPTASPTPYHGPWLPYAKGFKDKLGYGPNLVSGGGYDGTPRFRRGKKRRQALNKQNKGKGKGKGKGMGGSVREGPQGVVGLPPLRGGGDGRGSGAGDHRGGDEECSCTEPVQVTEETVADSVGEGEVAQLVQAFKNAPDE